ncbi:MAG: nicotinate mononucleotide-dependent phosphoribosyltransferase CobT [Prochlorothrix sp.]
MLHRDHSPIGLYSQQAQGQRWIETFCGQPALLACVFGFTDTGLLPGISAAGATPTDRCYTALADAEFLARGLADRPPRYPLPPLHSGISPTVITRALWEQQRWPLVIFNAGLAPNRPLPAVPWVDLQGQSARCVSTGRAIDRRVVDRLWQRGLQWGAQLAARVPGGYSILGECVVGGTTTALAVLTGLGIAARGRVNSSHPTCNHQQKAKIVAQGLQAAPWDYADPGIQSLDCHPLDLVAAVGDPMQVAVAGMAIAASRQGGVILAGGTQMLAVYALMLALAEAEGWQPGRDWWPDRVVVGTTRWVAEDPTGDTPGLAAAIGERWGAALTPCLMATQLSFAESRFPQLRVYEAGFVKEGVAAGGSAIATSLCDLAEQGGLGAGSEGFQESRGRLRSTIETFVDRYQNWANSTGYSD